MPDMRDYPRYAQRRQQRRSPRRATPRQTFQRGRLPRPYLATAAPALAGRLTAPARVRQATPAAVPAARPAARPAQPVVEEPPARGQESSAVRPSFERLRREQESHREAAAETPRKRRRLLRRPRTRAGMIALAIPVVFLIAAGAIIGPIVYRGTRAYQDVFVEPAPRDPQPFIAVKNEEGTPVIAQTTATAVPEIPSWDGTERITILLLG